METTKKSQIVGIKNAGIVIICCFIIAVCIYHFLLGNPSNFMNNDPNNHPTMILTIIRCLETSWVLFTKVVLSCLLFRHCC